MIGVPNKWDADEEATRRTLHVATRPVIVIAQILPTQAREEDGHDHQPSSGRPREPSGAVAQPVPLGSRHLPLGSGRPQRAQECEELHPLSRVQLAEAIGRCGALSCVQLDRLFQGRCSAVV